MPGESSAPESTNSNAARECAGIAYRRTRTIELRGFRIGRGRQPLSPEQRTDLTTLSRTLQCLLAEHGFTNDPVRRGPAGATQDVNPTEVTEIVQQVVAELRRRGLM